VVLQINMSLLNYQIGEFFTFTNNITVQIQILSLYVSNNVLNVPKIKCIKIHTIRDISLTKSLKLEYGW
jgi:hypothetical protein